MTFSKFIEETLVSWNKYLRYISKMQKTGHVNSNGGTILYPNILLITNCTGFYVAELIGATKFFSDLKVKIHKEQSIYRYLNQFDDSELETVPLTPISGSNQGFKYLCIAHESDIKTVTARFPSIDLYTSRISREGGKGNLFVFQNNFEFCFIENCVLINQRKQVYRCKNILSAYIFNSSVSRKSLAKFYQIRQSEKEVIGIHTAINKSNEELMLAGQLQSMYLFPKLHETTIGEFLKLHPDIIKKAFKTSHFEYEPYLEWKENDGTCEDTAINPDLLIKRDDGFFDIYDLKTAMLSKKNATKGGRKRRRFIDYVEEGIAQLANYQEYFNYPLNAKHAKEKYGIVVKDPKLVLIVGSWENSSFEEINQACRRYPKIEVIDYDTFCQLFIGTS